VCNKISKCASDQQTTLDHPYTINDSTDLQPSSDYQPKDPRVYSTDSKQYKITKDSMYLLEIFHS